MAILQIGSTGDAVAEAQRLLVTYGYLASNVVPGVYGPATADAVAAFQRMNGLSVDGIIGINTGSALLSVNGPPIMANGMRWAPSGSPYDLGVAARNAAVTSGGPVEHVDFEDGLVVEGRAPMSPLAKAAAIAGGLWALFLLYGGRR